MGYEGHVVGVVDRAERVAATTDAMERLALAHAAVGGDVVSAGGTGTFDVNELATEIQAGSYALMDTAYAELDVPFRPTLSIVATVISRNTGEGFAVADCGLKALGMDHGGPTVDGHVLWFCSDEHVTFSPPTGEPLPEVGDRVRVVPAHVDPTVAYHECLHIAESGRPRRRRDRPLARRPARLVTHDRPAALPCSSGMADDLAFLDATAQAELVRSGELTPIELVDAAITRVEKVNPELNAVIHPLFDKARAAAAAADAPDDTAPFRGVPIVLKDLDGSSAGDPLHLGNTALRDAGYVADHDSYLIARLRAAGFIPVGKANTPEFGLLPTSEPAAYGPTRNPWNTGVQPRGVERRLGGVGGVGHGAARPRRRRWRLDPHAGERVRALRAQAEPRPRVARPRRRARPGRASSPATSSPTRCATAPPCST